MHVYIAGSSVRSPPAASFRSMQPAPAETFPLWTKECQNNIRERKKKEQIVNFPQQAWCSSYFRVWLHAAVCTRNNGEKVRQSCGGYRSRDIRCVFFAPLPVGKRDVMDLLRHSRLMAFLFVIISFQIHDANAVPMVSYRVGNQLRLSPGWWFHYKNSNFICATYFGRRTS